MNSHHNHTLANEIKSKNDVLKQKIQSEITKKSLDEVKIDINQAPVEKLPGLLQLLEATYPLNQAEFDAILKYQDHPYCDPDFLILSYPLEYFKSLSSESRVMILTKGLQLKRPQNFFDTIDNFYKIVGEAPNEKQIDTIAQCSNVLYLNNGVFLKGAFLYLLELYNGQYKSQLPAVAKLVVHRGLEVTSDLLVNISSKVFDLLETKESINLLDYVKVAFSKQALANSAIPTVLNGYPFRVVGNPAAPVEEQAMQSPTSSSSTKTLK